MPIGVSGKAAIVTGAGRGIGKGIAEVFAKEGAKVLVVNRSVQAGEEVAESIRAGGAEATFFQADVRTAADMNAMAAACIERYGAIDILCLNAGIYPTSLVADLSEDMWDEVIDTNLKGVFLGAKACIPQMKKQKSGRIVVVSSVTGPNVGWPSLCHYMASKGGVNAFVMGLALELARDNITVNAVSPGSIMTEGLADLAADGLDSLRDIIPVGYIGEPEDIAYALLYFASDEARFVTGQALVLDGGQILPESPSAMDDA